MKYQKDHKKAATERQFSLTDGIISKKKTDYRKYLKKDLKYLDPKQFSFFMKNGFLSIKSSLPKSFHDNIYSEIGNVIGLGKEEDNPGNNLLPLIPNLIYIFEDPIIKGALKSILGDNFMLHPHRFVHDNPFGSGGQAWHHDTYWGYNRKIRNHRPWWLMVMYLPQDTFHENGPTGILPGSQFSHQRFNDADKFEKEHVGKAGTCMLIHYDIWHHKKENFIGKDRFMVKFEFVRKNKPIKIYSNIKYFENINSHNLSPFDLDFIYESNINWFTNSKPKKNLDIFERKDYKYNDNGMIFQNLKKLSSLKKIHQSQLKSIENFIFNENENISINAAFALSKLGKIGRKCLSDIILSCDGKNTAEPRVFFDEGQESKIGMEIRNSTHALISMGNESINDFIKLALQGNQLARRYSAFALGEIYSQNNKIAPILEVLSKDDNESVRISAIESLGLKKGSDLSKKALSYSLLNDKDDEVRSNAALSFWRLSGSSLIDLNVMYDALNDSNRYVRAYILEALEQVNTVKSRSILLHELKTSRWCQMTTPKSMF